MSVARQLRIHGRVQGVFYRGWAVETARALGLVGWVCNRRNGTVEAFVQGDRDGVGRFVELARRGPPAAQVTGIEVSEVAPDEDLATFERKLTT